jgi:hypothetical protein
MRFPGAECNRLGVFWRHLIDMTDSAYVALLLRAVIPVAGWPVNAERHRSWFAMIGVPGSRWQCLMDLQERLGELRDGPRALLMFHLTQLSFTKSVRTPAGVVEPDGDLERDRYAYAVARVHSRYPDRSDRPLSPFGALSRSCPDLDETDAEVATLRAELAGLHPHCVEARSVARDGCLAAGNYAEAAEQYRQAGQRGTAIGAVARWLRARQYDDFLGDRAAAINAMGRCAELGASAIEPREYIREHSCTCRAEVTPTLVKMGTA